MDEMRRFLATARETELTEMVRGILRRYGELFLQWDVVFSPYLRMTLPSGGGLSKGPVIWQNWSAGNDKSRSESSGFVGML